MCGLISIIVPVYNVVPYIETCLKSIVEQTYKNLEILVIDDGSTDGSEKICDEYAQRDSRIYVLHKKNEGVSKARNDALDIMKGDCCIFIDADDWISPDFVEELYNQCQKEEVDMVFANQLFTDDQATYQKAVYKYDKNQLFDRRAAVIDFLLNSATVIGKLYRKTAVDGYRFPEGIKLAEDECTELNILLGLKRISFHAKSIYYRRIRPNSASRSEFDENDIKALEIREQMAGKILSSIDQVEAYVSHFMINKYAEVLLKLPSKGYRQTEKELLKRYRFWYKQKKWYSFAAKGMNIRFLLLALSPQLYRNMKKLLKKSKQIIKKG